jgi:hypothetical protein
MSDTHSRLAAASAAWTRLFHNTSPRRHEPHSEVNTFRQPTTTETTSQITIPARPRTHQDNTITQPSQKQQQVPIQLVQRSNNEIKQNTPWGDTLGAKSTDITRIYSQNVNGIRLDKDGGQYKELCTIHQEVQADILCIQEHNLDTTQYQVQQIIHQTTRKHWQRSRINMASSPMTFSSTWKPGGTAILSTGSITGRLTATGSGRLGQMELPNITGTKPTPGHDHQYLSSR